MRMTVGRVLRHHQTAVLCTSPECIGQGRTRSRENPYRISVNTCVLLSVNLRTVDRTADAPAFAPSRPSLRSPHAGSRSRGVRPRAGRRADAPEPRSGHFEFDGARFGGRLGEVNRRGVNRVIDSRLRSRPVARLRYVSDTRGLRPDTRQLCAPVLPRGTSAFSDLAPWPSGRRTCPRDGRRSSASPSPSHTVAPESRSSAPRRQTHPPQ